MKRTLCALTAALAFTAFAGGVLAADQPTGYSPTGELLKKEQDLKSKAQKKEGEATEKAMKKESELKSKKQLQEDKIKAKQKKAEELKAAKQKKADEMKAAKQKKADEMKAKLAKALGQRVDYENKKTGRWYGYWHIDNTTAVNPGTYGPDYGNFGTTQPRRVQQGVLSQNR